MFIRCNVIITLLARYSCLIGVLILAPALITISSRQASAQLLSPWSPQQRLAGYGDESVPPYLVVDQNRTVHALGDQQIGDGEKEIAVIYNQWTVEQGWTMPIDILLSPIKHEARVMGAFLDQSGTIHVIFIGGDETEANVYYSSAPVRQANQAPAWSTPVVVGEGAVSPRAAAFTGNDKGDLFIVYSGNLEGNGLYGVYSNDSGLSWSTPALIYQTYSDDLWPWGLRLFLSQAGALHAIWNVVDVTGQGRMLYYAQLATDTLQWEPPILLAETPTGLGVMHPNVIEQRANIFAVYIVTPKITVRRSLDGGATWTDPVTPFTQHVGVNGNLAVVVDGNNDLHLFWGQRIPGDPDLHGMWHSKWQGNEQWLAPDAVVSGPRIFDLVGYTGFDPFDASAVVSQGNVILVTWRTDPGGIKPNGVWYSYATVDALELPLSPLPTQPVITLEKPMKPVGTIIAPLQQPFTATLLTDLMSRRSSVPLRQGEDAQSPVLLLLSGLLPVILLVTVTTLATSYARRHR